MSFLMKREAELTPDKLGKIIQQFMTKDVPKLNRYYNYYKGKQDITLKTATDVGKPNNKAVFNYCSNIVNTYSGYLIKNIAYNGDNLDDVMDVLNYNDVEAEDKEMLRDALIFGKAVEINYIDEESKQRFKMLDPREVIDIYDDTLNRNLLYAIRFYQADYIEDLNESYIVEVYDEYEIKTYKSNKGFSSFELLDYRPHFFNQVPLTFMYLNKEETSIFDQVMTLQDAYNLLTSAEYDDFQAFTDCYLVLKGMTADEEDLKSMKEHKVLMLDTDATAEYLTKSINDTQIQNMLDNLNKQIHKIACCPDFSDENFMAQSGIAMQFKTLGMENMATAIEKEMKKALQKRIELICSILKILGGENVWREIDFVFTRNIPQNDLETAQLVNSLRGLVSDETLLAQLPFVDDPTEEYKKLQEQKEANMAMYDFGDEHEEVIDDDE